MQDPVLQELKNKLFELRRQEVKARNSNDANKTKVLDLINKEIIKVRKNMISRQTEILKQSNEM